MNLVQSKVAEIVAEYGTNDPKTIAAVLRIPVIEEFMPPRLHGVLCSSPELTVIYVNRNLGCSQQRAALAHELGHLFLHPSVRFSMLLSDRLRRSKWERQADEFAACLLVSMDKPPEGMTFWELAEELGVPEDLIKLRFNL